MATFVMLNQNNDSLISCWDMLMRKVKSLSEAVHTESELSNIDVIAHEIDVDIRYFFDTYSPLPQSLRHKIITEAETIMNLLQITVKEASDRKMKISGEARDVIKGEKCIQAYKKV